MGQYLAYRPIARTLWRLYAKGGPFRRGSIICAMFVEHDHCRKFKFTNETLILDHAICKITMPRGIHHFGGFRDLSHCGLGEGYDPDHGISELICINRVQINTKHYTLKKVHLGHAISRKTDFQCFQRLPPKPLPLITPWYQYFGGASGDVLGIPGGL